jgi:hypothetical protein
VGTTTFRPLRLTGLIAALGLAVGSVVAPGAALAADNQAPVVTAPEAPIHISEAAPLDTVLTLATFTDDGAGPWAVDVWGWGGASGGGELRFSMSAPGPIEVPWPPYLDYTNYQVAVSDGLLVGYASGTVVMDNVAPELSPLTLAIYTASGKAETHSNLGVSASSTDPGSQWPTPEKITCTLDYGDGQGAQPGTTDGRVCYGGVTYWYPGVYPITMVVTDAHGASDSQTITVTVIADALTVTPDPIPTIQEGTTVTPAATFSGGLPWATYSCSIDYSDGTVAAGTVEGDRCTGPAHDAVYGATGDYPVWFTVTDDMGETGIAVADLNYVNAAPAITSVGPLEQTVGVPTYLTIAFDDPGLGSASPETYSCWIDFGDWLYSYSTAVGNTCASSEHSYGYAGTYTVTIAVDDGTDGFTYQDFQVVVTGPAPHIDRIDVPDSVAEGIAVSPAADFTTSGFDETCWVDYGDGTYAPDGRYVQGTISGGTCTAPDHVCAAGTYTISFEIWAADGTYDSASKTITVVNRAPVMGQIDAPETVAEGTAVQATADFTSSGLTETCSVDFGDGTVAAGTISGGRCAAPSHVFVPGSYAVTFTIAAANGTSASGSKTVTVTDQAPVITPANVVVEQGFAGPIQIGTWTDFGTGTWTVRVIPSVGQVQEVLATQPGPITIAYATSAGPVTYDIFVIDPYGQTAHATASASFVNVPPTILTHSVSGTPAVGADVAVGVTFSDPGFGAESYTCTVDYGDGGGPQAGTISGDVCTGPVHTYVSEGTYTVVAAVTDSNGGVGSHSLPITINNLAPQVGPVSAPATATVGTAVTASATYVPTGLDPADTCTVDYGDGSGPLAGVADGAACTGPAHVYTTAGTFRISVKVTAATGASASSSASIVVTNPPISVGPVSIAGRAVEGASVTASAAFTPLGRQTYTCSVDYGDGTASLAGTVSGTTCKGPSHKLGRAGNLTVTVAVAGSNGSTGQSTKAISVANVGPAFTKVTIPTAISLGTPLTASVTFSDPGTTETYQVRWIWGDGTTTTAQISGTTRTFSATHRYAAADAYAINISLTDGVLDDGATVYYNPTVAVHDPARTVSGSGTFASPAGSCTLSPKCAVASTASFSLSASYARGAKKPAGKFTFSAAGISLTATSYDWLVAANGSATMTGTGTVNGVSGYRYYVTVRDASPDWIQVYIVDSRGRTVYLNDGGSTLKSGSLTVE